MTKKIVIDPVTRIEGHAKISIYKPLGYPYGIYRVGPLARINICDRFGTAEADRVEAGIRCFDPCLSCSTHAAGQMPLHVELVGADGSILNEVYRD